MILWPNQPVIRAAVEVMQYCFVEQLVVVRPNVIELLTWGDLWIALLELDCL